MLRILYVQSGLGIGGAKISLYHLISSYSQSHHTQVVLSKPADREYLDLLEGYHDKVHELWLPSWIKKRSLSILGKNLRTFSILRRGWYLTPALRLAQLILQEGINLVHSNSIVTPVGALGAWIARKPHIWHVREPVGKDEQYQLIPCDWAAFRLIDALSNAIICNSQYTGSFFQSRDIKVQVINNGLDIANFEKAATRGKQMRMELGLPADNPVIGMVASLRAGWKEHDVFLHFAAQLQKLSSNCQFVVFGSSLDLDATPYTRYLRDLAKDLNLNKRLVWADFFDDVPAIMHSFDLMVHPTSREGSGRVVMEAMAAGRPVIGVRSGGVQELIQDGNTGFLVPTKDAIALSEACSRLINNPILLKQMGCQALSFAQKHFSHVRTAAAVQDVYTRVMAQHRTG